MQTTVKVAVSLPKAQFQLAEKQRRVLHVSRSAMVRDALANWLKSFEEQQDVQRYIEGYRKHPQSPGEIRAMAHASAKALQHEAW